MRRIELSEETANLLFVFASALLAAYWIYACLDALGKWDMWRNTSSSIESLPTVKEGGENAR